MNSRRTLVSSSRIVHFGSRHRPTISLPVRFNQRSLLKREVKFACNFCTLVEGTRHDMHFLHEIPIHVGTYYVRDRGFAACRRVALTWTLRVRPTLLRPVSN